MYILLNQQKNEISQTISIIFLTFHYVYTIFLIKSITLPFIIFRIAQLIKNF